MDSSAYISGLEPAAAPQSRRALPWGKPVVDRLFALPNDLGVAIAIATCFSAVALLIAFVFDAPLSVPRERVSAALGINAVLPFAFAVGIYVLLRAFKSLLGKTSPEDPPWHRVVCIDTTLMVLFLVVTYFHFSLKTWAQVINPNLYDTFYYGIDIQFREVIDTFNWLRSGAAGVLPHVDSWYQGAFLLMFIAGFCTLSILRDPVYPQFCIAVLLTMCLGSLSYLIAPAVGPFIYEEGLNPSATEAQSGMLWAHRQVKQYGMDWIAAAGSRYFTGALAAMPSLHIAHAVVMTYFISRARTPLTVIFVLVTGWVVIESVASRWHYLIDLPAGLALAVLIIWLTNRLCRVRSGIPNSKVFV